MHDTLVQFLLWVTGNSLVDPTLLILIPLPIFLMVTIIVAYGSLVTLRLFQASMLTEILKTIVIFTILIFGFFGTMQVTIRSILTYSSYFSECVQDEHIFDDETTVFVLHCRHREHIDDDWSDWDVVNAQLVPFPNAEVIE